MPILEICQLKIKPHLPQTDPSLLLALQKARTQLREKVVNTQSRFYRCIEDPSLIYILGIWPSLNRHKEFLASSHKAEILDEQDELFDFQWIIHTKIGDEGIEEVPIEAPVMGIARFFIKKEGVNVYQAIVDKYGRLRGEGTKPYKSVAEWRVDCKEGKYEHVVITGWENEGDHADFTKRMREDPEYKEVRDNYEGMDVKHARDMER
ncbi:hypothetical protein EG329_001457 [Mollisiaceae sp. DMI_Dod_QoI]|nr:hypothetical protein EG329_001457 [Helotiales sp. DMI_Dod_QoI]